MTRLSVWIYRLRLAAIAHPFTALALGLCVGALVVVALDGSSSVSFAVVELAKFLALALILAEALSHFAREYAAKANGGKRR